MDKKIQLKPISLTRSLRLKSPLTPEQQLGIILLLKLFLIALPASFFLISCASQEVKQIPFSPVKIYSLQPQMGGILRGSEVIKFDDAKNFIVIKPTDFSELFKRCPVK